MTYLTTHERQTLNSTEAKALNDARRRRDQEFDSQAMREGLAIPRAFRLQRPRAKAL